MPSPTLEARWPRSAAFLCGAGMMIFSALTIRHFFAANYPASIWQGSFCDISAFFNCNSSAFSPIAAVLGIPLGYFGLMTGALVSLGALFPSPPFQRTNQSLSLLNLLGVVSLLLYSVFYLKSLCLLCSGYYVFSALSLLVFWKYGDGEPFPARFLRPSLKYLATFAVIVAVGAYGFREFHATKKQAQSGGAAARIVDQYFALPMVKPPSVISPYWTARSTARFEDAPIQVIEYADFLCPDCLYLYGQFGRLKQEFKGKINIAFQFFPLEAKCNNVVSKDLHPGACELAYFAAQDPAKFAQMHDEIFDHYLSAKKQPEWRRDLARRYGVETALTDPATQQRVRQIINTGAEFEKTSDKYAHGVRSTPTMIINNRMIIGTFPYEQLRAIFQALVDRNEPANRKFLENWQDRGK